MRILADENIPYSAEIFGKFGDLVKADGRHMPESELRKADALIIRSITRVNSDLLDLAPNLKFVGTCTIGTDHVDIPELARRGIGFSSAPGCNRISVGEYIMSVLAVLSMRLRRPLRGMTLGIVGGGNTGSAVYDKAKAIGMEPVICDPPLSSRNDGRKYVSFDEALSMDAVTFHVPLIREGELRTYHMLEGARLMGLAKGKILINASRGAVIPAEELIEKQCSGSPLHLVLDTWENEPAVSRELAGFCDLTTPHIAGYSLDGKARGTEMIGRAFMKFFGIQGEAPKAPLPEPAFSNITLGREPDENDWLRLMLLVYDVRRDSDRFMREYTGGASFDHMRKTYLERREWSSLRVSPFSETAKALGFACGEEK